MTTRWMAIALYSGLGISLLSCDAGVSLNQATFEASSSPSPETMELSPSFEPGSSPRIEQTPIQDNPVSLEPLPAADADGNYPRTSHRRWIVVDPDPAGLNCRWSEELPAEWYSPATVYPRMNVNEWTIVRQFPTGTELQSNITPAGFAIMYDEYKAPWLKISIGDHDEICLVRANTAYVEPLLP